MTATITIDIAHIGVGATAIIEARGAGGGIVTFCSTISIAIAIFVKFLVAIVTHCSTIIINGKPDPIVAAAVIKGVAPILGSAMTVFIPIACAYIITNAGFGTVRFAITVLIPFDMVISTDSWAIIVVEGAHTKVTTAVVVDIAHICICASAVVEAGGTVCGVMTRAGAIGFAVAVLIWLDNTVPTP